MQPFRSLPALTSALAELGADAWIDVPESLAEELRRAATVGESDAELASMTQAFEATTSKLLVRTGEAPPHAGHRRWLPVSALCGEHPWPGGDDLRHPLWQERLRAELGHGSRFRALFGVAWRELDMPAAEWPPTIPLDKRVDAWAKAVRAWVWLSGRAAIAPASRAEIRACEWRIGGELPPALAAFHRELGCTDFVETLLCPSPYDGADAIAPLSTTYPAIPAIAASMWNRTRNPQRAARRRLEASEMLASTARLVAFGSYVGNGNQWCFHRDTGAVWYFDHDTEPHLTLMFDDVADYLDALSIKALEEARAGVEGNPDGDERAEARIAERWGQSLVDKWMY